MKAVLALCVLCTCACALAVRITEKPGWVYQSNNIDAPDEDTVTISTGEIHGMVYENARAFYGIPYAASPVGPNRWMPPSPARPWGGVFDAQSFGPGCPQDCDLPPLTCPMKGVSEDCLTLDVYTPRAESITEPRPVMVFFYGGNYKQGGSSTILYNGNYLANNTNVVVVVINYRLGALSFFINDDAKGNLATRDQTFSLQWVQENIKAFGGDPSRVTIFGQSAGGSSVACQMLSPNATGLFQYAIMESNPIQLTLKTPRSMNKISKRFADALGCDQQDMSCLRSKNTTEILAAQNAAVQIELLSPLQAFMPWQPYVDGEIITGQPMEAFVTGEYNQVPFMVGNTEDEGIIFIYEAFEEPLSKKEYEAIIHLVFLWEAPTVLKKYPVPAGSEDDAREVLSVLGTHYFWACPHRNLSRYMAENNDLYLYRFDHVYSFDPWGPDYSICIDYSCHGAELPFVFNSAELGGFQWSRDEAELAQLLSTHWGNFATSGDPNKPVDVSLQWDKFNADNDLSMHYKTPSTMETGYVHDYCDFWDKVGYHWGE